MQWFIIGRDMNVLANPSTDAEGSLPIDDSSGGQEISISNNVATGTYDFDTIANHKDSEHVKVGNYIAFVDKYRKHRLYTIMTVEGSSELSVHCEDIGLDLINEDADEWDTTGNPEPVAATMERVLGDTGWTIGINEIADRKRATKYTSLTDSQLARIGMIMNTFEAECDFEIIMEGSKVVKQVVNIYQSLGQDFTNQRFVDGQNLVALSRNESIEDLCTCMRCFGKENEETHQRLTIADVVYDDGRYYSPKGHTKIYDREAHDKWSRFRAYGYEGQTEFLGYINGTFEYDTDNAQELFNRGLSELKTKNEKKVAYEAELYDLQADIGDMIQVADHSFTEPTYISARIQSVKNHYTVKGEDTGVLANYKLLVSNPTKDVSKLLEDLKNQVVSVKSSDVSYQAGDSGTEVPFGVWSPEPVLAGAGKYLWTRIVIIYTDGSSTTSYSVSKNGSDGTPGKDGATYYTWIKYADDEYGNGISDSPDGKQYMGIANNKERMDESLDPADYQWSRITGEGIPGKPGADGKTYYTWVRYADDLYGNGMSDSPNGKYYIGLAFNKESQNESNNPQDYQWSKYRGDDGTPGVDGADGKTTYFHVKYSAVQNPTSSWEMTETPSKYIGTYVDFTMQDSTNPSDYTWSQFRGDPGENGIPGTNGQDGRTSYLHIAYANSSDGYTDFSTTNSTGKKYMGQYVDYTERDSENPYAYKWSKIKGEDGTDGQDGQDGVGISRITRYYLASNKNTGITTSTYGWTTTMQQITPEKKYLWSYENTAYTNGTSTNSIPIIIGVHGENGDSSGVTESDMPPNNPHMGMLWKNTGTSGGRVQGAVYRWNGSSWALFKLTASNIEAETFKGFEFIGANFTSVDEFISPHHIDDNTVVEAKHKVNLKISKGAIVATDDLYFKQGSGWTSTPQEHRLTQILAGNGIYCYIEDYRTGERKRMSLDADGFEPPQSFFNLIYPVGSIYMSVNPTNPSELFPRTAWAEWGKGRVPVGVDASQAEFNKVEKTGGSKSVALTGNQLPAHNHNVPKPEWYGVTSEADTGFGLLRTKNPNKDGSDGFVSTYTGKGETHSNLQPYITCYMWVRTA